MEHIDPDELVTSTQVCRELGVHPSTVSSWARDGILPVIRKLPGRNGPYLFRRCDVDRLALQRREAAS